MASSNDHEHQWLVSAYRFPYLVTEYEISSVGRSDFIEKRLCECYPNYSFFPNGSLHLLQKQKCVDYCVKFARPKLLGLITSWPSDKACSVMPDMLGTIAEKIDTLSSELEKDLELKISTVRTIMQISTLDNAS